MVYKRYIKRGDKVYGPYIYSSKKKDGKVISTYHGKGSIREKIEAWGRRRALNYSLEQHRKKTEKS